MPTNPLEYNKKRLPLFRVGASVLSDRNRYALKILNIKGWSGFALFESYNFTIHLPHN